MCLECLQVRESASLTGSSSLFRSQPRNPVGTPSCSCRFCVAKCTAASARTRHYSLASADRLKPSPGLLIFNQHGGWKKNCKIRWLANYLIVESRRPCESVSTRPTVQHIGHPRSATRAATLAPKDSQGCAVWWTMAQASSAAAAAPRIRCAPSKALPNMPTPRK